MKCLKRHLEKICAGYNHSEIINLFLIKNIWVLLKTSNHVLTNLWILNKNFIMRLIMEKLLYKLHPLLF